MFYLALEKEKQLTRHQKWYRKNRAHVLEYKRKWGAKNKDKQKQYASEYYLKNKSAIVKYHKKWNEENREKSLCFLSFIKLLVPAAPRHKTWRANAQPA